MFLIGSIGRPQAPQVIRAVGRSGRPRSDGSEEEIGVPGGRSRPGFLEVGRCSPGTSLGVSERNWAGATIGGLLGTFASAAGLAGGDCRDPNLSRS